MRLIKRYKWTITLAVVLALLLAWVVFQPS